MRPLIYLFSLSSLYLIFGAILARGSRYRWIGWSLLSTGLCGALYGGAFAIKIELKGYRNIDPRRQAAQATLTLLQEGLQQYKRDVGGYPTNEAGLEALFINPGSSKWRGPYAKTVSLLDPWGMPYGYRFKRGDHFVLLSAGPDLLYDTADDIILADALAPH